ncbi:GDNF-inducible zinc finger protein 1 [Orchesella cincta]|uniref:GDNF-inducible zinc finger protein 1 n=1 Tax=Orchesella cincta TaxID=48709 RepID=A0A1D2MHD9_ORCCI|nr:GDNF-inducible zinc finger protein 1 [Orchesella cincta]
MDESRQTRMSRGSVRDETLGVSSTSMSVPFLEDSDGPSTLTAKSMKQALCIFCHSPATFPSNGCWNEDVADVLENLCSQLMPNNRDEIQENFSKEGFPLFCGNCELLVKRLWGYEKVFRNVRSKISETIFDIEKVVVDGEMLKYKLLRESPSNSASSMGTNMRFTKLTEVVIQEYQNKLLRKHEESLALVQDHSYGAKSEDVDEHQSSAGPPASEGAVDMDLDSSAASEEEEEDDELDNNEEGNSHQGCCYIESQDRVAPATSEQNSDLGWLNKLISIVGHPENPSDDEADEEQAVDQKQSSTDDAREGDRAKKLQIKVKMSKVVKQVVRVGTKGEFEGTQYTMMKGKKVKCGCCNYTFVDLRSFKNHASKITYKCDVCSRTFGHQNSLKRHKYKSHGPGQKEKYPCPQCGFQFAQLSSLTRHTAKGSCQK